MKIIRLFDSIPLVKILNQTSSFADREVRSICFDSRKLETDCVFVAVRGTKIDGHTFIGDAITNGAIALVVEDETAVPASYKGVVAVTKSSRETLNKLAARFFNEPAKRLFNVGVTGTNGKTTTTYMTEAIFARGGKPAGVVGTINHHFGDKVWPTELTTPDPISFQRRLKEFEDLGAHAVALEVSSHALTQARVDEVPFDVAIFTNLSRDHLDYHKDMDDYFHAKLKLFTGLLKNSSKALRVAVVNDDDEHGRKIASLLGGAISPRRAGLRVPVPGGTEVWTYGSGPSATLRFGVLEQGFLGTRFRLKTPFGSAEIFVPMPGLHNVANACGAIGAGLAAGIPLKVCAQALKDLPGVPGRLEAVPNSKGVHVFVDYAHTDDALATVLRYLRQIRDSAGLKNKIITVFGCGGDRDRGKRPLMMKAGESGSDIVVVTSDNPRTEDPEVIINDALAAATQSAVGKTIFREVDRRQGIAKALQLALPGDVVLIAGKGHEDYQQVGTTKLPFSDVKVVKEILV